MVTRLDENPTVPERCLQVWQILTSKALNRQTITFTELTRLLRFRGDGAGTHPFVGPIDRYCRNNGLPLLSSLLIQADTGKPGVSYTGDRNSVEEERERVFDYHWFAIAPPTLEEFEQARR